MAHPRHILATGPLFCSWQPAITQNHGFCMGKHACAMTPRYFELAVRLFLIVPSANVMLTSQGPPPSPLPFANIANIAKNNYTTMSSARYVLP